MTKKSRSKWAKSERNSYSGPFAGRLHELLKSPAYRVLSLAAHRVLSRIEIELANHGPKVREFNGCLPCTYNHFEEYGLHHRSIAPAIRELEALGFIEVTQRGVGGNAEFKQMNLYRLTYRAAEGAPADGSHEWRRITTIEAAEAIADQARRAIRKRDKSVTKIIFPGPQSDPGRGPQSDCTKA